MSHVTQQPRIDLDGFLAFLAAHEATSTLVGELISVMALRDLVADADRLGTAPARRIALAS
jgi:hypothetical protein